MREMLSKIAKYNVWNGNTIPCGMKRTYYLDEIKKMMGNNNVKVLTGQRRIGKSFIMRQLLNMLLEQGVPPQNILFLDKEFLEFDFIKTSDDIEQIYNEYLAEMQPKGRHYLFVDEIQNISGWERFINSHSQDFTDEVEIFITGSNSKMLSGELATFLSGRYVEFPVFSYQYDEFLQITNNSKSRSSYLDFIKTGGLPSIFDISDEYACRQYISAIRDTVLLRDIVQRNSIRDIRLLDDIFIYLVSNASNIISIQNIVRYFKSKGRIVAYDTVSNYIHFIEESFLIHAVMRYHIGGKEVSESPHKYYINDLSFKNYLYPGIAYGVGYLLENAVFLELVKNNYLVYVGNVNNKEIDFVATKFDRVIYIQVSYSLEDESTRDREYSSLLEINDNYEKWIVTLDDIQYPIYKGIRHIQAWNLSEIL